MIIATSVIEKGFTVRISIENDAAVSGVTSSIVVYEKLHKAISALVKTATDEVTKLTTHE